MPLFYQEVRRILRPSGALAAWAFMPYAISFPGRAEAGEVSRNILRGMKLRACMLGTCTGHLQPRALLAVAWCEGYELLLTVLAPWCRHLPAGEVLMRLQRKVFPYFHLCLQRFLHNHYEGVAAVPDAFQAGILSVWALGRAAGSRRDGSCL